MAVGLGEILHTYNRALSPADLVTRTGVFLLGGTSGGCVKTSIESKLNELILYVNTLLLEEYLNRKKDVAKQVLGIADEKEKHYKLPLKKLPENYETIVGSDGDDGQVLRHAIEEIYKEVGWSAKFDLTQNIFELTENKD